ADDPIHAFAKAGQYEAVVAARRTPGDAAALEHHHRPAAARDLARGGEPGKAGTDYTDVDVEVEGERPAIGRGHHGRRVPARRVVRPLGIVHDFALPRVGRRCEVAHQ